MDLKSLDDDPAYIFAGLCTAGGVAATVLTKTSSPVIKGVAIGGLYGLSGVLSGQNKDKNRGIAVGLTASALLAATGVPRALKTQKAVPMAIGVVGLLNSAYYARKLYDRRVLEF